MNRTYPTINTSEHTLTLYKSWQFSGKNPSIDFAPIVVIFPASKIQASFLFI
jgi:hypothetical protein